MTKTSKNWLFVRVSLGISTLLLNFACSSVDISPSKTVLREESKAEFRELKREALPLNDQIQALLRDKAAWHGLQDEQHKASALCEAISRVDATKFYADDGSFDDELKKISLIATMATKAGVNATSRVLEVGTGSGFAAAVYTELGAKVYTVEIDCKLASAARSRLRRLGYPGIEVHCADGMAGWKEEAPFDTIFINLRSRGVPEALLEQLAAHGRVLVPVEVSDSKLAQLLMVEKIGNDLIAERVSAVDVDAAQGEIAKRVKPLVRKGSFIEKIVKEESLKVNQSPSPMETPAEVTVP